MSGPVKSSGLWTLYQGQDLGLWDWDLHTHVTIEGDMALQLCGTTCNFFCFSRFYVLVEDYSENTNKFSVSYWKEQIKVFVGFGKLFQSL